MIAVLDASALVAVARKERGFEFVLPFLDAAVLSTVNTVEVIEALGRFGSPPEFVRDLIADLGIGLEPFSERQALIAASIAAQTRHLGLSLGDRACLAVASDLGGVAITADRVWGELRLDVEVVVIR
ncbi:MAG: type II toxin-antitoxin system VapC family toxin [Actinomycetia bacterium]|nr:type II toxin-antitoxin system VapC family toxin [Actinomycetes bacterium]